MKTQKTKKVTKDQKDPKKNSQVTFILNLLVPINGEDNELESNFVDHERVALISQFFNEKQMNRYAKFKESSLENRKKLRSTQKIECPRIKKVVQSVLGEHVQLSSTIQIALHGITKIYAGELVEEAKKILVEEEGEKHKYGNIRPRHLREARRRLIGKGVLPNFKPTSIFSHK